MQFAVCHVTRLHRLPEKDLPLTCPPSQAIIAAGRVWSTGFVGGGAVAKPYAALPASIADSTWAIRAASICAAVASSSAISFSTSTAV